MRPVLALARLYLLGSLRRQAHLSTLFLGVALFMLPAYVNAFSLGVGAFETVSKDFGLTLIGYFSMAMAIFLGSGSVPGDLQTRSVYPILARPISRGWYLTAHFLSVAAMLAGSVLFLGICLMVAVGLIVRHTDPNLFLALYGSFLQAAVMAAFCLMLSVRFSPAVTASVGVIVFLLGSFSEDLFALVLGHGHPFLIGAVKAMIPDLSLLALKGAAVHHLTLPPAYLVGLALYALGWITLALLIGRQAFDEVDL